MSNFFLNNKSLNIDDFDVFKDGIIQLMRINKKQEHVFYRNDSCYEVSHFSSRIFPNLNDIDIFNIYNFFAKLSPCDANIQNEEGLNQFCQSEKNGFLGIDFNGQTIQEHKKIIDSTAYMSWIRHYQTNLELLTSFLGNSTMTKNFEKSYYSLSSDAQKSIQDEFEKAASRNLVTRFYPDTKIIKEVSSSNKCKVLELRVYQPVALRVYFDEIEGTVYLASIEQKSNPDQNEDIIKAEKLLLYLKKD